MVRLTEKQKQEQTRRKVEALRLAVEQSRRRWLGKRVHFMGFFNDDGEAREGSFIEVRDDGEVIFVGPVYPWSDDDQVTSIRVGDEEELLSLLVGVVVEG